MNNLLKIENNRVLLCGKKNCCPSIENEKDNFIKITDDEGNTVRISKEQAALIPDGIKTLESLKSKDNKKLLNE